MIKAMHSAADDSASEVAFRSILGLFVLAIAIACANIGALPIDQQPFMDRLSDETVRRVFTTGYFAQIVAGISLALALLLDVRPAIRPALLVWLAALCLFLAPAPTVREAPLVAALPLASVLMVTLVGWALDRSLREQPA